MVTAERWLTLFWRRESVEELIVEVEGGFRRQEENLSTARLSSMV